MGDSKNHERILQSLMDWKNGLSELDYYGEGSVWRIAHDLAEAEYQPAISFFVMGLKDPDWIWRQDCVRFLGFHYAYLGKEIVERFRTLLLEDPSDDVRMSAAAVLGIWSNLPDQALFQALEFDSNHYVRKSAFDSILKLMGLPYKDISRELKKLRDGTIQPTLEYIRQLVCREGIEISEDLLTRSE